MKKTLAATSILLVGLLTASYYSGLTIYFVVDSLPHQPFKNEYILDPPMTLGDSRYWKSAIRDMMILGITPAVGLHLYFIWLQDVFCEELTSVIKLSRKIYKDQDSLLYRKFSSL